MYYAALEASCELAKEQGPYESYDGSPVSKGVSFFFFLMTSMFFVILYYLSTVFNILFSEIFNFFQFPLALISKFYVL